jgi:hypothetical protein
VGGDPVEGQSPPSKAVTNTEIFYKQFPFYLAIGMTYDQYWNEDCTLVKYYREAHQIKLQQSNHLLWWQGMYFYEALCNVAPLYQMMTKSAKKVALPYPKEPYPITLKDAEELRKRQEAERFAKMKARMEAWQADVNQHFKRREQEADKDG